ncbi:WAT1-related protein At1g70260 isoform X2 [Herrania umbratica]|uniref:WAT1-related protein n=1 Tax=Herrania umbratica TaxID=108875 RepID=A0A6J1B393_9ROSI|nr:WAT1-related protein At1g70260 isoform X2 [Herrania umbratica]
MGVLREKMGEVVPFTLMVIMEGCTIGLTILAKTAITGGMSPFVFVVYTNVIGSLLLLPFSFIFHRERTEQSLLTFPLLVRIFFLGLTGIAVSQNLAFVGLSYSSPIVVCAMGLLTPSLSFLLSIIPRRTRPNWRSSSSQAEVTGTLISIMGAVVVELYKGPFIRKSSYFYAHQLKVIPKRLVFYSAPDNWILGAILLAAASLSVAIWNVIQLGTVKQYPQVMKVASFYSLAGTIQCLVFSLIMERDLNAWKLKLNLELLLIVVTGVFGSIIRSNVHLACSRMKGPFYVPMFKPFGIVFATFFGVTFTNSLHYGSVIGTLITGMGYYAVMWGQIREEELRKERDVERTDDSSDQIKAPLLQKQEEAQV